MVVELTAIEGVGVAGVQLEHVGFGVEGVSVREGLGLAVGVQPEQVGFGLVLDGQG
ncbi:MAG: hypothetical protein SFT81_06515 [Candidatus Caenarcaniphilales bacterium]|nr:hypothetical protein [Candidatus Caenarcaniphilales bacterium]